MGGWQLPSISGRIKGRGVDFRARNVNDFPSKVTDGQGGTILMQYDALGNTIHLTASESRVTFFVYDARGRIISGAI